MSSSSCYLVPLQLVEVNNFILIRKGCHILVLGRYGKTEFVLGTRWLFAVFLFYFIFLFFGGPGQIC